MGVVVVGRVGRIRIVWLCRVGSVRVFSRWVCGWEGLGWDIALLA